LGWVGVGIENFGLFKENLVPLITIWYISWTLSIFCRNFVFFTILLHCTKKNLATPTTCKWRPNTFEYFFTRLKTSTTKSAHKGPLHCTGKG
jgi:endonuclease/exonuclease/phosphatase (EEP) superfamily protein YafD